MGEQEVLTNRYPNENIKIKRLLWRSTRPTSRTFPPTLLNRSNKADLLRRHRTRCLSSLSSTSHAATRRGRYARSTKHPAHRLHGFTLAFSPGIVLNDTHTGRATRGVATLSLRHEHLPVEFAARAGTTVVRAAWRGTAAFAHGQVA
jgi:hypothetical protein